MNHFLTGRIVCGITYLTMIAVVGGTFHSAKVFAQSADRHLSNELSADDVLNGKRPNWPASPQIPITLDRTGLDASRLTPPPPPGVHPRVLLSPEDLPGLRTRLTTTEEGKAMLATLRLRTSSTIHKQGTWEKQVFDHLAAGEIDQAAQILSQKPRASFPEGHYQPQIPYMLTLEAFDVMLTEDEQRGRKVASAISNWARLVEGPMTKLLSQPMSDDVWRAKVVGPMTGSWTDSQGIRELMGQHLMGYAYDFSFNFMTDDQRSQVRRVIALSTHGRLWLGARLPPHFRNWNWVMCGLSQPLLALAIEGEEGYDPRVYKLGVEIARDYLTYGISAAGSSTEAVGYTQFGFVWGMPFLVAASRRGDELITHTHHRAMLNWYAQSIEPFGGAWQSHGDGGDRGPEIHVMSMWRYFFPNDPKINWLWQNMHKAAGGKLLESRFHMIEPMIWSVPQEEMPQTQISPTDLNLPTVWHDGERGGLNARSGWSTDAAAMQFECRIDSHGPSHEHADRGVFTFSALGRTWAREQFRSIESRHHNTVLIDGVGQGYWPGPGNWLGNVHSGDVVLAGAEFKSAYDWWWPKQILDENPQTFERFKFPRWKTYQEQAIKHQQLYGHLKAERDDRPAVVNFWKGFEATDPRLWDEDGWPVRLPHNPVEKAKRLIGFVSAPSPYMVIWDNIRKDNQTRLYEWIMMTGSNTEVVSVSKDQIILADATHPRDASGFIRPPKGSAALLVKVLEAADPEGGETEFHRSPSIRLETFERRDTTTFDGRSFGTDRRLIIPSRSVEPKFKIVLYPFKIGDELPVFLAKANESSWTVKSSQFEDTWTFEAANNQEHLISVVRKDLTRIELNQD